MPAPSPPTGRRNYQRAHVSAYKVADTRLLPFGVANKMTCPDAYHLLGKKTVEAEILREAVEVARDRKWISRSPLLPGDEK